MEAAREKTKKRGAWKKLRQEGYLEVYLMLLPGLLLLLIFRYLPMGGLIIAFQDFNIFEGIGGSEFVGLANFRRSCGTRFSSTSTSFASIFLCRLLWQLCSKKSGCGDSKPPYRR